MLKLFLPLLALVAISRLIWHERCPLWLRICALTFCGIYAIYVTGVGVFIRPYFTNMEAWSLDDNKHFYYYRGTGVFINATDVLTNQHVVDGCKYLGVRTKDQTYLGIVVASEDADSIYDNSGKIAHDLAVIRTTAHQTHVAAFRHAQLAIGQETIAPEYSPTPGVFTRRTGHLLTNGEQITFNGLSRKGNSGSPIYDENGYYIGTQHSASICTNPFARSHGIATHSYYVAKFLEANHIAFTMAQDNAPPISDSDDFQNNFAVGILCSE